ncbi:MAG TPA: Dyp-type peroxidase, partial [Acidimicrobiales bacterium]|nr:Dyp-type peroxidase [Acidimicrobiales bacterium]
MTSHRTRLPGERLPSEAEARAARGTISRRRFLQAGALAGSGAVVGASGLGSQSGAAPPVYPGRVAPHAYLDGASTVASERAELSSFEHGYQSAMLSEPTPATAVVSYDVIASSRAELADLLRTVTTQLRRLYAGGLPVNLGPASPQSDNGILGQIVPPRQVAFVLGVGASLFDGRFGLSERRPATLTTMQSFANDDLDPAICGGDLSLQIMAADTDTVVHAVREIAMVTRGGMQPRWRLDGFHSPPRPTGTPRNLFGFKDGIANPDTADARQMDQLIWVQRGDPEPAWTARGTYQVVRIIRMLTEFWDRVSLNEQERMIGRRRASGAPLSGNDEYSPIDYEGDPQGNIIPLSAHIRLANPRTPATEKNRILRRGWNYDLGVDQVGNLDMGLIFICYQQDVERQFENVQK